ncbi:MAG TPA: riboflavin synthase [Chryseolinea sp.]|nr:riboflavin synthase [Chryseolinea sp.]
MFTGIVETMGRVVGLKKDTNAYFQIESIIGRELKVDQSVSHNGVCLTVVKVMGKIHHAVAISETLLKSNMGSLRIGDRLNLERCMLSNGRFDGHIVQGHVDQTGIVKSIRDQQGSWLIDITYDPAGGNVTVEKGSIAVNGVSLTCFNSLPGAFTVAIIPFTYEQTTFNDLKEGDTVNLEFDIIGKYVKAIMNYKL